MAINSNLIEFEGKYYAFDIDRFFDIVTRSKQNERMNEQTINQTYGYPTSTFDRGGKVCEDDFILVSKEVSENKNNFNDVLCNVKYDMMKNLFQILTTPSINMEGSAIAIGSVSEMHFGQMLAFNTFIKEGILVEISEKE